MHSILALSTSPLTHDQSLPGKIDDGPELHPVD